MNIENRKYHSIWLSHDNHKLIQVIDQRFLPHELVIMDLTQLDEFAFAIMEMVVRGAPLIGITAAYGMYIALLHSSHENMDSKIKEAYDTLLSTRPTASNLKWALDQQMKAIEKGNSKDEKAAHALANANYLAEEDIMTCQSIGNYGLRLIEELSMKTNGKQVNILTHCNAGWLATVDYGTATAPIYLAHDKGIKLHVWVDETRPRNQGANLTAYELGQHGIPHTVIVDNAGGHLMQHGMVDLCIVGTDRTTTNGDVCNKIGTYLKALAAYDNNIPFYVALPSSTIDWEIEDAFSIPIEERNADEVKFINGYLDGKQQKVRITPKDSQAANYAFDVTPARLVTALITEKGICEPNKTSIMKLFPEKVRVNS